MRRKDAEVTCREKILAIMHKCDACFVSFMDGDYPYTIPLSFGFAEEDGAVVLYFHGANEGKKLELLAQSAHVSFAMSCEHLVKLGDGACNSSMQYQSVCGRGQMTLLPAEQKAAALNCVMQHYAPGQIHTFPEKALQATAVMRLVASELTAKKRG